MKTEGLPQVKVGDVGDEKLLEAFVLTAESIASSFLAHMKREPSEDDLNILRLIEEKKLFIATQGIVTDKDESPLFPIALMNESDEVVAIHPLYFEELCRVCVTQILSNDEHSALVYGKGDELFGSTNWKINYYLSEAVEGSVDPNKGEPLFTLLIKGEPVPPKDEVVL